MTTGQRISAKRKELNLSQEALGEALNVSRQSIYKWESDASLPEIDKLIALSRLYGVSVGWLLGVEEQPAPQSEEAAPPPPDRELTETQLRMVEEIVGRYLAAQPKPKKRRWPYILAGIVLFFAAFNLFEYFDVLEMRFDSVNNNINRVEDSVDAQINSITKRVEEILKSQNDLTADYSTEMTAWDLSRNTVTFTARTVPKTYVEGMEVYFLIDSGDGPAEIAGTMGPGREFTAELTCELTDNIVISAVFATGDTRQTQLLDSYGSLYSSSLPDLDLSHFESTYLHQDTVYKDGKFQLPAETGYLSMRSNQTKLGTVHVNADSARVGLFKNYELIQWLTPCEKPANYNTNRDGIIGWYHIPELQVALEQGDILHFAAIYEDEYGRPGVAASLPAFECFGTEISWTDDSNGTPFFNISNYSY